MGHFDERFTDEETVVRDCAADGVRPFLQSLVLSLNHFTNLIELLKMKPLMIFDGDCGFCRRWILRWQSLTGETIDYAPYQEAAHRFPHIPKDDFAQAVHLIDADGKSYKGAEAVFRSLAYNPRRRWLLWLYNNLPGFAFTSDWAYGFVSRHRDGFSTLLGHSKQSPRKE